MRLFLRAILLALLIITENRTVLAQVRILDEHLDMPQLYRQGRIWLYLPPGYETSRKRYPVLYMTDGQNLFDAFYGHSGEWGVDEALDSLYQISKKGLIVVGVDHGGESRLSEYTPWPHPKYQGGGGSHFADFLVQTLKPYIDRHYRTKTGARHTGMAGSSLGGLMSFYTASRYPQVFSRVGVFSPSFWFSDSIYSWAQQQAFHPGARIYFLAGEQESEEMVPDMNKMYALLDKKAGHRHLKLVVKADGQHQEWFWRREFPELIKFLF
jgi:predicted alpha/beta superfamily hydrolase